MSSLGSVARARRSPWRRLRRLLLGLVMAGVSVVVALAVLISHLDAPWVKRRVQGLARTMAGVDIDYGGTQVQLLSGLRITELAVLSPPRFRALAPELLHVASLEVGWSLRAIFGQGVVLTRLALREPALTIVRDADGRTSLSELGKTPSASSKAQQKKPTPPSHLAAEHLGKAPPLLQAAIDGAKLTLLLRDEHQAVEQLHLSGLGVSIDATPVTAGHGWQLHVRAGENAAPLSLALRRERESAPAEEAMALLWLEITLAPTQAQAMLELRVGHQTLAPTFKLDHLLSLAAQAHFDSKAGRTELSLSRLMIAGGAATLDAGFAIADAADTPPFLQKASGIVELTPLLGIVPTELLPISAHRGQLRFDLKSVKLANPPRLVAGGHANIDGDFDTLRVALFSGELFLPHGTLELQAEPSDDQGTAVRAKLPLHGLHFSRHGEQAGSTAFELSASGHIDPAGAISGEAALHFGGLERTVSTPAGVIEKRLAVRAGHLSMHATEVRLELAAAPPPPPPSSIVQAPAAVVTPLEHALTGKLHAPKRQRAVHGLLTMSGQLDGLLISQAGLRAEIESLEVAAQARLAGGAPYGLDIDLPLRGLKLSDGQGRPLYAGPAHINAHVAEVYPELAELRRSRGDLKLAVEIGAAHLQLDAHKHPTRLDFDLTADATSLVDAGPLMNLPGFAVPWERMALTLHSQGQVEALFSPQLHITQRSELRLERPALTSAGGAILAQTLQLTATTSSTAERHSADLDLVVRGLTVRGESLHDAHLTLSTSFEIGTPALRLRLSSDAESGPQGSIVAALAFDRAKQALSYDVDIKAAKLAPLQPFLAKLRAARGFDLSALELSLSGKGTVVGLLTGNGAGAALRLVPHPLATAGIDGTVALRAAGLYWSDDDRVIKSPLLAWRGTLSHDGQGQHRRLHAETQLEALHIEFGEHEMDFSQLGDSMDLTAVGDLAQGEVEIAQHLNLGELQQDLWPGYVLKGINLSLRAQRNHDGELRIDELKLANAGGGTIFDLQGHLDIGADRRSLSLHGTLDQQLDRLWSDRNVYIGRGTVSLNMSLDSGDLVLYHTEAAVQVKDVDVQLPRSGMGIEGLVGEVPIRADIFLDKGGAHILRSSAPNIYSQIRYADQHPMLSGRSFISLRRFVTPLFQVADLAGNLRIDSNLVSLSQFELGLRGGHVSGQCLVDFREEGPTLQLRIRASRIDASQGEPFDGNAAVVISGRDRSVEGRAEILRIGRRHLLSLLDLHDPQHSDASFNRIRRALSLGYPDRLSLSFAHGFAQAEISFAGLARLVRVDPLRGIPMGPIIDKMLPRKVETEEGP